MSTNEKNKQVYNDDISSDSDKLSSVSGYETLDSDRFSSVSSDDLSIHKEIKWWEKDAEEPSAMQEDDRSFEDINKVMDKLEKAEEKEKAKKAKKAKKAEKKK